MYIYTHTAHKTCKCFLFKQENSKHNQPYQQGEKKKTGDFFFSKWDCKRETGLQNTGVGKQSKLQ